MNDQRLGSLQRRARCDAYTISADIIASAVMREMEIIKEAATRLSENFRSAADINPDGRRISFLIALGTEIDIDTSPKSGGWILVRVVEGRSFEVLRRGDAALAKQVVARPAGWSTAS